MSMTTKRLAIAGKVIVFNDLENKSLKQFEQQLKQNGVTVTDEQAERMYNQLRKVKTQNEKKGE